MEHEARTQEEEKVYGTLEAWGVPFAAYHHEPAYTMEQCAEFDRTHGFGAGTSHCKNLFLCNRQKTKFYLLVIDGDKPFRTADISRQLGVSRLSFGPEEQLLAYLGCHPGAIGPMGLLWDEQNEVELLLDEDLKKADTLLVHPGVNTATIALSSKNFFETYLPRTVHAPRFVTLPGAADGE